MVPACNPWASTMRESCFPASSEVCRREDCTRRSAYGVPSSGGHGPEVFARLKCSEREGKRRLVAEAEAEAETRPALADL